MALLLVQLLLVLLVLLLKVRVVDAGGRFALAESEGFQARTHMGRW